MAKKKSESSQQGKQIKYELIRDLGDGMLLVEAELSVLREQDVNARILPDFEHSTLVNNIRKRGRLESAPYCALVDGRIEIVSGHHRVRAAREAGIKSAPILLDSSGLSRSQIIAKQLAHNRLAGFDDEEVLLQLFSELDDPDLIIESGLAEDLGANLPDLFSKAKIDVPNMDINFKQVNITFLPHQIEDVAKLDEMISSIPECDESWAVPDKMFMDFQKTISRYSRIKFVRNYGTLIHMITEKMLAEIGEEEAKEKAEEKTEEKAEEKENKTKKS